MRSILSVSTMPMNRGFWNLSRKNSRTGTVRPALISDFNRTGKPARTSLSPILSANKLTKIEKNSILFQNGKGRDFFHFYEAVER